MLEIRGLAVDYGAVRAVDGVDLTVEAAETLTLLGRSGSGKTSLLLGIAGVVPVSAGTVALDGTVLTTVPTHERRIGVVFQDFALFPHLTVAGNVGYGLRMAGVTDPAAAVAAALDQVDLAGYEARRIDQLSGGQAQRVALARTLVTRPKALLLDEPLGSLDPALRASVAAELAALLDDIAIPTIIVTHDPGEAFGLGDRVAVLDRGRIGAIGTPAEVWHDPRTAEVARILGHRNLLEAEVHDGIGRIGPIRVPLPFPDGRHDVLVLPAAVHRDPSGASLPVLASRFTGPAWVVTVRCGAHTLDLYSAEPVDRGREIGVELDPSGITRLGTTTP
jgi:ABC-type Fe3+/spermidine/putrescine transport system ATPase subunit